MGTNKVNPKHLGYARENRKRSTRPEQYLWSRLRNRRLFGYKFRRQHPIYPYIVDFACLQVKLVVEVDGNSHFTPKAQAYDARRTAHLEKQGYTVIRFTNREVMTNIDGVCQVIAKTCQALENKTG